MERKKAKPPSQDRETKWIRAEIPRGLHKRLRKSAIDMECNIPQAVVLLLDLALIERTRQ